MPSRRSNPGPRTRSAFALSLALHAAAVTALFATGVSTSPEAEEFVWAVRPSLASEAFEPVEATTAPAFAVEPEPPLEVVFEPEIPLATESTAAVEPTELDLPAWREATARRLDASAIERKPCLAARAAPKPAPTEALDTAEIETETDECPREAAPASDARPEVPTPLAGHQPPPDYPDSARRRRIGGTVLVRMAVDDAGLVADCAVIAGSGCAALDAAALDAARRWRFDHGPGAVEVPFTFRVLARS